MLDKLSGEMDRLKGVFEQAGYHVSCIHIEVDGDRVVAAEMRVHLPLALVKVKVVGHG